MKETASGAGNGKGRRKLLAGLGILSLFSFLKIGSLGRRRETISCTPPGEKETVKLLSQDGKLVEVDVSKIKKLNQKITNKELQQWVRRK
jgi:hypothetical protein